MKKRIFLVVCFIVIGAALYSPLMDYWFRTKCFSEKHRNFRELKAAQGGDEWTRLISSFNIVNRKKNRCIVYYKFFNNFSDTPVTLSEIINLFDHDHVLIMWTDNKEACKQFPECVQKDEMVTKVFNDLLK